VVALKLKDGKEPASSDSYENSELVTYVEAKKSSNPKPYIAAVVTSSGVDGNMFVLGDGRNTSDSNSRKRRSTTSDYFNGPLEPGTSYSVFQRIIINEMVWYWGGVWGSKLSVERTDLKTGLDYGGNSGHIAIDIEWALQEKYRQTKGQIEAYYIMGANLS
jgi:hypothetical protein